VLQGFAQDCKSRIDKQVSFPCLALCCTVLRSRWCQSGVNWCQNFVLRCHPGAARPCTLAGVPCVATVGGTRCLSLSEIAQLCGLRLSRIISSADGEPRTPSRSVTKGQRLSSSPPVSFVPAAWIAGDDHGYEGQCSPRFPAGSECSPQFQFYGVQNLLRTRGKRV